MAPAGLFVHQKRGAVHRFVTSTVAMLMPWFEHRSRSVHISVNMTPPSGSQAPADCSARLTGKPAFAPPAGAARRAAAAGSAWTVSQSNGKTAAAPPRRTPHHAIQEQSHSTCHRQDLPYRHTIFPPLSPRNLALTNRKLASDRLSIGLVLFVTVIML